MMKKYLLPCLSIVAVVAIILAVVFGSQKGKLQKTVDDVKAQRQTARDEAAAAKTEAEKKLKEA